MRTLTVAILLTGVLSVSTNADDQGDQEAVLIMQAYQSIASEEAPPEEDVYGCEASWTNFCPAKPNSTGETGHISVSGSMIVSENNTSLHADNLPVGRFGMFIYGPNPGQLPFGDGILCISPFNPGVLRLGTPQLTTAEGTAFFAIDFNDLPDGGQILGEDVWFFQFMHRDLGDAGFNLTDAAEIHFCP